MLRWSDRRSLSIVTSGDDHWRGATGSAFNFLSLCARGFSHEMSTFSNVRRRATYPDVRPVAQHRGPAEAWSRRRGDADELTRFRPARSQPEYPPAPLTTIRVTPQRERLVREARLALNVLLAAVAFVLLHRLCQYREPLVGQGLCTPEGDRGWCVVGAGRARVLRQFLFESATTRSSEASVGFCSRGGGSPRSSGSIPGGTATGRVHD